MKGCLNKDMGALSINPQLPLAVVAGVIFSATGLFAAPPDYVKDIKPLLRNKCSSCHGAKKQKSKLRLDAGKFIHAGSKEGEVIVPGKANTSELITRVLSHDEEERMPPEGAPLTAEQVAQLQAWINAGAKFPADEVIASAPKEHWAYQPVKRPELPKVKNRDWTTNPIDYFILAKLEAKGWRSNPSAKPFQLLRRAHLDITGLPPTLKEQENFAKDPDLPRLIDNLLARKGYGERYARHWLDVVRYADTNGYERDGAKPQVWRYRDYVIRALNSDKPFDRFLLEQLAGDELPDASTETVIATGFHRLGPWDDEPADFAVDRFDQLDDIINTTSQTFLGLTMGCARCHEHKFDPFTQEDYYSMVAIFNPLQRSQAGRTEKTRYAAVPALATKLETRDKAIATERTAIKKIRTEFMIGFLRDNRSKLPAEVQLAFLVNEPKRNNDQKKRVSDNQSKLDAELNAALPADLKKKITAHESIIAKLRKEAPDMPQGYFLHEPSPKAPETRLLKRGNPKTPGEVMEPAVPVILTGGPVDFLAPTKHTTRRRFTLARWMARPNNPLTARVIVNRAWQWHFGQGIVRTPNDFGLIGERPTHPALLDWMAHWFVHDANWSLKKLHRLIMTSSTWQMSRETRAEYAGIDPENQLIWRMPYRRLEVEAIRDSMLFVSGKLNRKMYGSSMHPFVPRDALLNHADKTSIWPKFNEESASRRTVYAFVKRSLIVPMLEVLDLCDTTQTSPQRNVTTVPTQALTLYNGNFAMRQARHLANRLIREVGNDAEKQITLAWHLALSRPPSLKERNAALKFLVDQLAELKTDPKNGKIAENDLKKKALTQFARVIFNLNEFVYAN